MLDIKYNNKGFSLIEVIVALGVFTILASSVINVATNSYGSFYGTGDKQVITEFAQEGIEVVKAIRDNSWQDIEDVSGSGSTYGISKASGGYWEFTGSSNILGALTRTIAISDVSRDTTGEIVSSGGIDDPNTKKVTVTITGSGMDDYVLTAYLIDWSYETWLQTDWSGVGDRKFWGDNTMASSTYSNISTSTAGEITLSGGAPYNTPGYIYSSIYDLGSDDQEIKSVSVEQSVPSGCDIDITVELSSTSAFSTFSSKLFSSATATYYTSSTPANLNGKRFMRYRVDMTACDSNNSTPTLKLVKINYR